MIKTLIVSFLGVSSVRAAQAFILRSSFVTYSAVPARRLSFAEPSLEPSLEQKINKGCTMGFISYLCG